MGLKLTPLDVDESEMFKMYEKKRLIDDLRKQALRLNHPAVSQRERERQLENIYKKIQKVLEQ